MILKGKWKKKRQKKAPLDHPTQREELHQIKVVVITMAFLCPPNVYFLCRQVLLALLHPGDENSVNAFWYVLAKISNDHDMAVAVQGCLNFLNNRRNAANTWIPGSQKDLDCQVPPPEHL